MSISNKSKIVSALSLACILSMNQNQAKAGIVKIINESSNSIITNIIQEPASQSSSYCWKCLDGTSKTNGKHSAEIIIPLSSFNGQEYFAVKGSEGGFLGNGECRSLNVFKNYEVSFYETFMGVGCSSKEI